MFVDWKYLIFETDSQLCIPNYIAVCNVHANEINSVNKILFAHIYLLFIIIQQMYY